MTEEEDKRIYVDAYKRLQENAEYEQCFDKMINLESRIMELLGPFYFLFLEYDKLSGLAECMYKECIYHIGLEDGQKLHA